jgi:hypothetical protein
MNPVIGVVDYENRELWVAGTELKTANEYQLKSGTTCVYGEVLKRDGDYLSPVSDESDIAYTIANEDVDATSEAKPINYAISGSANEDKVVCAVGTVADFRDSLQGYGISLKKVK